MKWQISFSFFFAQTSFKWCWSLLKLQRSLIQIIFFNCIEKIWLERVIYCLVSHAFLCEVKGRGWSLLFLFVSWLFFVCLTIFDYFYCMIFFSFLYTGFWTETVMICVTKYWPAISLSLKNKNKKVLFFFFFFLLTQCPLPHVASNLDFLHNSAWKLSTSLC